MPVAKTLELSTSFVPKNIEEELVRTFSSIEKIPNILKLKDKNKWVSYVQEYINWHYYIGVLPYLIKVDGMFGRVTQDALIFIMDYYKLPYNDEITFKIFEILQTPLRKISNLFIDPTKFVKDGTLQINQLILSYLTELKNYSFPEISNQYLHITNNGGPYCRYLFNYIPELKGGAHCAAFVTNIMEKIYHTIEYYNKIKNSKIGIPKIVETFHNKNLWKNTFSCFYIGKYAFENKILMVSNTNNTIKPGYVFLEKRKNGTYKHTGFVYSVDDENRTFKTLESNTVREGETLNVKNRYYLNYDFVTF